MHKFYTLLVIIMVISGLLGIFIGCSESSSVTSSVVDGIVNLRMEVVTEAPYGYSTAPQKTSASTLITDSIADKKLVGCAIIISKVNLITSGGKEVPIFTAKYREDGAVLLLDNNSGSLCNMVDSAPSRTVTASNFILKAENVNWIADAPEGSYKRMEMKIEEVCVTYKTDSGTLINWHEKNFNKLVALESGNQFTPFSVARNATKEMIMKFNLSGRVGKVVGEFEPDVYLVGVN
ncbi:MAG: hypothetical protein PHW04_10385 [Candidatus Wallbacteria bacterium]|nr:hypothetical protein [Candidatus Wallbacteria bacterium]